ncbi:MAG: lytic transglycosylase domain-containing protein [Bacteroidetes bacterium]|nr:lytic transglycosylase domain-containing protein [Bacteroidota bacterium]
MKAAEVLDAEHFHLPKLGDTMTLFGEQIDLTDIDIRERLDKELHTIVYRHSHVFLYFRRANRYFDLVSDELKSQGVPNEFKYLALVESGFEQGTSISGAQGFWQFMPKTAAEFGLKVNKEVDERKNFVLSTRAASSYLRRSYDSLNSWISAAAAYNRGVGGIRSDLKGQKVSNFFDANLNSETARYVFRIMAMKLIFTQAKNYGFNLEKMDLYPKLELKYVQVQSIKDINEWAVNHNSNAKIVLTLNPWILGKKLSKRPEGYQLALPKNNSQFKLHS